MPNFLHSIPAYLVSSGIAFVALQTTLPTDPFLHLLSSFGLGGVMFYFYQRDVVGTRNQYEKIIKENTEAITKLTTMLEQRK